MITWRRRDGPKVMPGLSSEGHVIDAYHVFYNDESIAEEGGMCALELQVL